MRRKESGRWFDILIDEYIEHCYGRYDPSYIKEFRYGRDVDELIVEFKDGTKDIYDGVLRIRTSIKSSDDIPDYNDEEVYRKWFARNLDRQLYRTQFPNWKLARATGISEISISLYLNGHRLPNALNIFRICSATGMSYDDLMNPWKVYEL